MKVWRSYGSTEHPSITGSRLDEPEVKRITTDGRALEGVEIRLDADGQILSRGPDCFMGYTDPDLTAAVFDEDGWYRTGDVGILDDEGYLTITDRISDIIIRGGENISAQEIEEVLLGLDAIAEANVVAAPDERWASGPRRWSGCATAWPPPPSTRCAPTSATPDWPARSGPRRSMWSRTFPAPVGQGSEVPAAPGPPGGTSRPGGVGRLVPEEQDVSSRSSATPRPRGSSARGNAVLGLVESPSAPAGRGRHTWRMPMTADGPRIAPLPPDEWPDEMRVRWPPCVRPSPATPSRRESRDGRRA